MSTMLILITKELKRQQYTHYYNVAPRRWLHHRTHSFQIRWMLLITTLYLEDTCSPAELQ